MKLSPSNWLLAVALSVGITSCVDPSFVGGGNGSGYGNGYGGGYGNIFGFGSGYGGGYGGGYGNSIYNSYTTLPSNYSGNAYNHNGIYYTGGKYQTGNYNHQGQSYNNRYYHNGQYFYGGNHQNYSPQQGGSSLSSPSMRVNTAPSMQQHSNNQFMQRRR